MVLVSITHSIYKRVVVLAKSEYGHGLAQEYIDEHCTHARSLVCKLVKWSLSNFVRKIAFHEMLVCHWLWLG